MYDLCIGIHYCLREQFVIQEQKLSALRSVANLPSHLLFLAVHKASMIELVHATDLVTSAT